jgi:creatinine amidohydrolase
MIMPINRYWREMPSTAFGPEAADWIVVLPLAAIEQHGPHLPVGVDAIIAEGMIKAANDALPDDLPVTFLPVQEVAKSNEHGSFPGTLTLDWKTAINQWLEIGRSVARAGARTLVMVTSHGGNVAPMEIAARELRVSQGMRVVTTSWGRLGEWQDVYPYHGGDADLDIHAGLSETSLMLALRPDLVDMGKAKNFSSDQSRMRSDCQYLGWHGAKANMAWMSEDLNYEGAVGDAANATAELGKKDINQTAKGFVRLMTEIHHEMAKG